MRIRRQNPQERLVKVRKVAALRPGDQFIATITDVQPTILKMQLENGESLTARPQVFPDARIGEQAMFMVKENRRGQILLERVRSDDSGKRNTFDMRV